MLPTNSKPQLKRYNEISMVKNKKQTLMIIIVIVSILLGVGIVVGSIYLAKYLQKPKLPTTPTVDDSEYYLYRNTDKFLTAWSPSSNSTINGFPAYRSLLTDKKQIGILQKFIEKHKFNSLFIYGGCVQWDSKEWVRKQIPYANNLRSYFDNFPGQKPGIMIYLNDDKSNFTSYENVQYFGQSLNEFNTKQLDQYKINQVYLQINPNDEGQTLLALEAGYLLKRVVGENINVLININSAISMSAINLAFSIYPELFISQLVTDLPKPVAVSKILQLTKLSVIILDSKINQYQQKQAEAILKQNNIQQVWQMFNATSAEFEVRQETVKNVQNEIQGLKTNTNQFGFSSYLEYFVACYGMEPIDSDEAYLIDLYRP